MAFVVHKRQSWRGILDGLIRCACSENQMHIFKGSFHFICLQKLCFSLSVSFIWSFYALFLFDLIFSGAFTPKLVWIGQSQKWNCCFCCSFSLLSLFCQMTNKPHFYKQSRVIMEVSRLLRFILNPSQQMWTNRILLFPHVLSYILHISI